MWNNRGPGTTGYDIEFKAGRLCRDGTTNWVRPDLRQGVCYLKAVGSGAVRLRWVSSEPEGPGQTSLEEYVFFQGDAEVSRVAQSEGRVYVVKSKSTATRLFYWMQGADADADDQTVGAINALLSGEAGDMDQDEEEDEDDDDEMREALALSRRAGERLAVARETPSNIPPLPTAQVGGSRDDVVSSASDGGLGQLRHILSTLRVPASSLALQLGDVLSAEHVMPVLADPLVRSSLRPTLPDGIPRESVNDFECVVRSPQFRQALAALSHLLEDGQIAPVVAQLGLPPGASASVAAFLDAVAKKVAEEQEGP
ncbi:hypothetical protein GGI20_005541 [Coemansia sp. BCRC 34301]|nr:hypothetical protein GGI20_005541 [Coemansia sp. BCRC 34301]